MVHLLRLRNFVKATRLRQTDNLITTTAGAELTGYTAAYVRQLILRGKLPARKTGRDWLVSRAALLAHKAKMDELGSRKHNPHR